MEGVHWFFFITKYIFGIWIWIWMPGAGSSQVFGPKACSSILGGSPYAWADNWFPLCSFDLSNSPGWYWSTECWFSTGGWSERVEPTLHRKPALGVCCQTPDFSLVTRSWLCVTPVTTTTTTRRTLTKILHRKCAKSLKLKLEFDAKDQVVFLY